MKNEVCMRQQQFIDGMLSMSAERMVSAFDLWSMGSLSREERELYPVFEALSDWRVEQSRPRARRNGNGFPTPTSEVWMLIDTSNSNTRSRNYCWWFETRNLARRYKHWQNKILKGATVEGPYHYKRVRGR